METAEAARRWARTWQLGWESLDADAIVALYRADARHSSAPFREPGNGIAGVRAYVEKSFREESKVRAWFGEPLIDGERAAVAWWATMVEDGRGISLAGTSVIRFDEAGLVMSQWDTWNQADGRIEPLPGWSSIPRVE